jgi:two-component system cell cycle response regulator
MKILVVDDDPVSALVLRKTLERLGHEPLVAANGAEALQWYHRQRFPVIVSDWMMPQMDGLTLCHLLRDEPADAYTYFILLTAKTQRRDRLEALQAGVDDFLTKPLDPGELAARMNVADRILVWDQKLRELNASLVASSKELAAQAVELDRMRLEAEYLATHDGLTGVLNRRAWFESASLITPTAIAVFDIDHFKAINDRHGHPAGDRVLQEVTGRLVRTMAPAGCVGRVGGEEFGVLFEDSLADAESRCRRAVEEAMETAAIGPNGRLPVTISGGLVPWSACGTTFEESMACSYEAADRALYEAKRTGRQRLVVGKLPRVA